jgi:hypothetical protein
MRRVALVAFCLFSSCGLAIAAQGAKASGCGAPKYKVAKVDAHTDQLEALAISIRPKDVTIKNLFAIACQMRADYPTQTEVGADIFNDEKAAMYTPIYGVEFPKNSNEAAYLGSYHLNRQKGVETLTLAVDQQNPCGHNIQVDLKTNSVSVVSCK